MTDYLRTLVSLESLSFKDLSKKLVLLLALSSAQRKQTLQALNVNNMSIEETKIVFTVVQRLRRLGGAIIRFELWFQKHYEINQFALILICYIILIEERR